MAKTAEHTAAAGCGNLLFCTAAASCHSLFVLMNCAKATHAMQLGNKQHKGFEQTAQQQQGSTQVGGGALDGAMNTLPGDPD